ncbi:MAG: hypothetical protein F9K23_15845 [Bacteroidetes bacterium]|nr:MAG: hypothetical protein F9K23_15845 [Bacteroidota bacterium]
MKNSNIWSDVLKAWVPPHVDFLAKKVLMDGNSNEELRRKIESGQAKIRDFEHYSATKVGVGFAPNPSVGATIPLINPNLDIQPGLTSLNRGKVGKEAYSVIYGVQVMYGESANTAAEALYVNRVYGINITSAATAQPPFIPVLVQNSDYRFNVGGQDPVVIPGNRFFVDDTRIVNENGQHVVMLSTPIFVPGESQLTADVLPAVAGTALGANACVRVNFKMASFIV